ncbi:P-loop containing nucleoside triphosphate hydrolase protein [Dactylonectria estremocensis]|uniref:P-loop containing nucleoside triphosphate hydrolase protein n=1 Tax=Dactylonectria estremocensis TaxID=1079267 RepID=A0A9P9EX64_9HYPO|nr:P-loop containing nucleoside triphosphate hydrolase protein [Dactylonectria estremocensis]
MLRRSKNAIILPGRQNHRRFLKLSAQEQHAYDIAKQKAIECLKDALVSRKPQEGYRNALQKINALRVICELGCSPQPGLQVTISNSVAYGSLLTPGTPDGSSTPSTMMDDTEDDDCGSEMDKIPFGNISSRLEECFPSYTTPGTGLSPCPSDQSTEWPVSSGQWPTKIQALIEDLQSCAVGTKSVVFSYRKLILDVAAMALRSASICCVQIDGELSTKKRSQIINAFSKNEAVQVLFLSLGCGAVGAYLLEPQWNPSIEEQAPARIHRLGQTQEVTTIRFVISGSIEQYVLDIQDGKRDLISLLSSKPANGGQVTAKLQRSNYGSSSVEVCNYDNK